MRIYSTISNGKTNDNKLVKLPILNLYKSVKYENTDEQRIISYSTSMPVS